MDVLEGGGPGAGLHRGRWGDGTPGWFRRHASIVGRGQVLLWGWRRDGYDEDSPFGAAGESRCNYPCVLANMS